MKNLFGTFIISCLVLTLLFSCKKEKDQVKEQLIGSMKATIGTTAWEAQEPVGKIVSGFLELTGLKLLGLEKQTIVLSINAVAAGTYDLNKDPLHGAVTLHTAMYSPSSDSISNLKYKYLAYSGSIVISSITENRASGTFNFKCANSAADTIQVSGGEFKNILYIK
jgi:hypothetical protein